MTIMGDRMEFHLGEAQEVNDVKSFTYFVGGYDYPVDGPPYGAVYAPRYDREPMRPVPKSFNDAPPMETAYRGPPSDSFPRDYSDRMMGARSR